MFTTGAFLNHESSFLLKGLEVSFLYYFTGLQQDKELMERLNQLKKDRKSKGTEYFYCT